VLAEDDVLLREGLASLLERSDYEVVGRAVTGLDVRWLTGLRSCFAAGLPPGWNTAIDERGAVVHRDRMPGVRRSGQRAAVSAQRLRSSSAGAAP